jgi:hypothetical protein
MVKIWSELRTERLKELIADIATLAWTLFWAGLVWTFFQFLVGFAEAGRVIRNGGQTVISGGRDLGESLAGIPFVGENLENIARDTFGDLGRPLSEFGADMEKFIVLVAVVLAAIVAVVTIGPWLNRYLPWRWRRLERMRAAHRAIRVAVKAPSPVVEEALALRAVTRLDYGELLDYTPDPLGDWTSGRYDRLARAELASVGLRPTVSRQPTG